MKHDPEKALLVYLQALNQGNSRAVSAIREAYIYMGDRLLSSDDYQGAIFQYEKAKAARRSVGQRQDRRVLLFDGAERKVFYKHPAID